ncbi:SRPBCC family protein [Streptomyces sp. NPDC088725]|uniref:SRPBCC family protein n=1 Tax=Streptomyces sp. NPDC088725 TaxID=3365873 RepID=UPI00382D2BBD
MSDKDGVTDARAEVELLVDVPADKLWAAITDLERIGEWSPECAYARWHDGWSGPVPGARFTARNEFPDGLITHVECLVTAAEPTRSFGWKVYLHDPGTDDWFAAWHYDLLPAPGPEQTLVRQSFAHGPGDSGLRKAVRSNPDEATAIVRGRLDQLRDNMSRTVEAMVRDIRST